MQRVEPDVLDREDGRAGGRLLATPGGLTDLDPVGCMVASAAMAGRLDEGFQEHGAVALTRLALGGQLPLNEREDLRCQTFGLDPGQNQEAGIVHHQGEVPLPRVLLPADEALARGEFPGAGAEAQQGDLALVGEDEVATLTAGQGRVTEMVVARIRNPTVPTREYEPSSSSVNLAFGPGSH